MVRDFSMVPPSFRNGYISCVKGNYGLQATSLYLSTTTVKMITCFVGCQSLAVCFVVWTSPPAIHRAKCAPSLKVSSAACLVLTQLTPRLYGSREQVYGHFLEQA